MKRGGPLKRTAPLTTDPDVTRAFVQRGRGESRKAAETRRVAMGDLPVHALPLRREREAPQGRALAYWPPRPAPKIRVPVGVRLRALARSHDVCVMCLHREGVDLDTVTIGALRQLVRCGVLRAATQAHHVWPRQKWPNLIKVEANLTGLCRDCHSAHEFPGVKATRIPRAALPSCAIALAGDDGPMLGYLERVYPT